jgi:hypothetical protein
VRAARRASIQFDRRERRPVSYGLRMRRALIV